MAIIAILIGLSVFGITIVQQNARDVARMRKVDEMEIRISGMLAAGKSRPGYLCTGQNPANSATLAISSDSAFQVDLPDFLNRAAPCTAATTTSTTTNYCNTSGSGAGPMLFVVGAKLESGKWYFKTNSGYVYTTNNQPMGGMDCADGSM